MLSNLVNQLKEQGALARMDDVLAEIPRVREDLGYPPLVTPTSQIVGTQAVLNVLTGERYKSVTNEVKSYLLGRYGAAPGTVNEQVRKLAVGNQEVITCRPADLMEEELDKLRGEAEGLAQTDEDVLTYAMFPELARTYLQERAAGTLKPEALKPREAKESRGPRVAPNEFTVTLHGESYHIKLTGTAQNSDGSRPYYVVVDGVPEEVVIEVESEVEVSGGAYTPLGRKKAQPAVPGDRPRATHAGHVKTAMPGNVVDVLVKTGQKVTAGDPVLVVEAMKMENEIQAPVSGTVISVFTSKGDAVTPDQALIEIQPE
jgi:pyruvate carboxylase subunit B